METDNKNKKVIINHEKCKGCKLCVPVCPKDIITMSEKINHNGYNFATVTDQDKCVSCGNCGNICPDLCIEVYSN